MDYKQSISKFWQNLSHSWLHLFYPSSCLHCQTLLPPSDPLLCQNCLSHLDFIDPISRCPICFNSSEDPTFPCEECTHTPPFYTKAASVFDYIGPAATFVKKLKYSNQPYLAKGMAAYMLLQFDRLQWPLPDAIIPVPIPFSRWLSRGYNQSALLAEEISRYLNRPVLNAIKRTSGDFSQAGLNFEQRKSLEKGKFKIKKNQALAGKTLLLIDDVMTTGMTLHRCAETLIEGNPSALYALSFCRT